MRSRVLDNLRARLRRFFQLDESSAQEFQAVSEGVDLQGPLGSSDTSLEQYVTPIGEYYRKYLANNLSAFNSFALQSRSLLARDVYARAASNGRHDCTSLQVELSELLMLSGAEPTILQSKEYDPSILLSLANYLLDSARSDLDTHAGLQIFRFIILKHGADALTEQNKLRFVEALASVGEYDEQDIVSERFDLLSSAPVQVALLTIARIAHQDRDPSAWLEAMNDFYVSQGMHTILLKQDASLPILDRLTSDTQDEIDGPLVSIIMPTFSPSQRIYTAIESLLRQTWTNLEILVVDDGSPTSYDRTFADLKYLDSRIRVIRQRSNSGAYSARNSGLAEAKGTFITTHDDDDWSHPDKIAEQASKLVNDASIMATTAGHIRTTSDMRFRRINKRPFLLQTNYSSLMFRRAVTEKVGRWDTSKRGSDTELVERIKIHFGKSAVINLADKPLSFSRVWDGSLTSGEIYRGYFSYSRLLYRWAFQQWHRELKRRGEKPVLFEGEARPFAIPTTFEPANRNKDLGLFDVIYATDFNRRSKVSSNVVQELKIAAEVGLRVGYMQVNSPENLTKGNIIPELFEMQFEGIVTQVAETDNAQTKVLIVRDSSVGMFLDQFESSVEVRRGIVVHDFGTTLKGAALKSAADPVVVLRNLDKSFNAYFSIVGPDVDNHKKLQSYVPQSRLGDKHWKIPLNSVNSIVRKPGTPPVIGFHSFGNKYRWPSTRETFHQVYSVRDYQSFFYGNLAPARDHLGEEIFSNKQVIDPGQTSLASFFTMIDFWIHYPHPRLAERAWKGVLEALGAGKVVILPPSLEATYGDAAVYATPDEVASVIVGFSNNHSAYIEQAERGRAYIAQNYSRAAYVSQLEDLGLLTKAR